MKEHNQLQKLQYEEFHDACGIGFIADSTGNASRKILEYAIEALKNMSHRGASGADERTGDGTGVLVNIPFEYFSLVLEEELGIRIKGKSFGIGMLFTSESEMEKLYPLFKESAQYLQLNILGKRTVPVNKSILGEIGRQTCPLIMQIFIGESDESTGTANYTFETRLYLLRKTIEQKVIAFEGETFICSLSSQTIVYKGMMKPAHLARFYQDLTQPEFKVKVALFHDRFSTNTISNWAMAQPFRMLGHNGEINTIKGNRSWMLSRESEIQSDFWNGNLEFLKPIVSQVGSDSYSLDNILEFLVMSGRSMFQSIMMLIPEPYVHDDSLPKQLIDFYSYHENLIEPWDGPAALVFTDGKTVGAKLDRNGLRPLRYSLLKDGIVIMASEAGVVEVDEDNILMHHHMRSGENLALALDGSGFINDAEIKQQVSSQFTGTKELGISHLHREHYSVEFSEFSLPAYGFDKRLRVAFGFDKEDVEKFIFPMAESAKESLGSMGDDSPPALFSFKHRRFTHFFKQQFAQVTNPPIDSIRERHVMSLFRYMGSEAGLLNEKGDYSGAIRIEGPVLSPREVRILKEKNASHQHAIINCLLPVAMTLEDRIAEICHECEIVVLNGAKLIFLSDEGLHPAALPIPMQLIVAAVHQHLLRVKLRNKCSLLCFSGDICEDHDIACLIAFGASAVYPYMAYELICEQYAEADYPAKQHNYRVALEKGLLKIMAKMGISTLSSYHGSFLFNAIGLAPSLCEKYFPTIRCALGGLDTVAIQEKLAERGKQAFTEEIEISETGRFRFRKDGEAHGFSPAVFKGIHNQAKQVGNSFNGMVQQPVYIRDFVEIIKTTPAPLSEVEGIQEIKKRFGLGAISFGAISEEVHRTLAKAATILGIRSNTGEGGEQKDRYSISNPDRSENCYTKQIASGRFGVTAAYLTAAREIQIKMGQGAKPGEGGQLPGDKVTLSIANDRHTTPGVPLISPPPHHDIYSIEDLAQLIYDLRQVNPRAKICVKLVSQFGIGIIASGVVKAGADIILISGHDGGTGASPLGSIKNTAFPWEIGLTEVHRTLLKNGLRNRV
ncbi:MAG: glutamate synthase subunit alpha, partial [Ignavibacteriales bacterium]|nr:glutamate synthase subunit alpha [Ignavibacteriales bacterium]